LPENRRKSIDPARIDFNPGTSATSRPRISSYLSQLFLTGIAYYFGARLGELFTVPGTNIGLVWPPVGISLAFVLLFGYYIWPAIALAAFVTNLPFLLESQPLPLAVTIAASQTIIDVLEVLLGAYLLIFLTGNHYPFKRVK
jgi:integral membrane sensor domain MASE1